MKEKILIAPLVGMGDTLMTTPALKLLKQQHPDWHITYCTLSKNNCAMLENNPNIDNLVYFPLTKMGMVKGSIQIIKEFAFRYSVCFNPYPSNRIDYNGFSFLSFAPRRLGHRYNHMNFNQCNWLKNKTILEDSTTHCVEQNVRLLQFLGLTIPEKSQIPPMEVYLTPEEKTIGEKFRSSVLSNGKVIGVHAGTSSFKGQDKRRWPRENFVELIKAFPNETFVLFGSDEEKETNHFIQGSFQDSNRVRLVENRPIREVASIIGTMDAFLSNDSGLMHLAAAMRVAIVSILGPTNANYIHPWGVPHVNVSAGLSCSPCFYYSPKPLTCTQAEQFRCLPAIKPHMVAEAIKKVLQ